MIACQTKIAMRIPEVPVGCTSKRCLTRYYKSVLVSKTARGFAG